MYMIPNHPASQQIEGRSENMESENNTFANILADPEEFDS